MDTRRRVSGVRLTAPPKGHILVSQCPTCAAAIIGALVARCPRCGCVDAAPKRVVEAVPAGSAVVVTDRILEVFRP